jgi:nucleoside-diphosphate-sugar epimerase
MKVLILGVDGFIGHALATRILASTGWQVVGLDRTQRSVEHLIEHPRFRFRRADLTTCHDWVDAQIHECDVVLPLAACARPMEYVRNPLAVFELDFEENLRIVRECFSRDTRLVFPSTSEVYGMCEDESFNAETSRLVLGPIAKERWMYACAKQMLDRVIWAYGGRGLRFTLFRPFNWFGPNLDDIDAGAKGSARVVTQFLGHLLRDEPIYLVDGGHQRRCFTHIDDGIDALMRILSERGDATSGQIFNIGNPANDLSIGELALQMFEVLAELSPGRRIALLPQTRTQPGSEYYGDGYEDVQVRRPDISRASMLLGWQPRISMRDGLRTTIAHYLERDVHGSGAPSLAREPEAVDPRGRAPRPAQHRPTSGMLGGAKT